MTQEFLKTTHVQSIARNGSFSRGLAHWFGCFSRHKQTTGNTTQALLTTPRYSVEIARESDAIYPSGIDAGIHQFIDHPHYYVFPSKRRVGGVIAVPVANDRMYIYLSSTATVDGQRVVAASQAYAGPGDAVPGSTYTTPRDIRQYFQHPFLYRDESHRVKVEVGSEISYSDNNLSERTGLYRAGRVIENYPGALWAVSNHILEVLDPLSRLTAKVGSSDEQISSVSITQINNNIATVVFAGNTQLFVDRNVARGDVLRCYDDGTDMAGIVSQITYGTSTVTVDVRPLENRNVRYFPFFNTTVNLTLWDIFETSTGTATVIKNTFDYDLTLAYSCSVLQGYDAPISSTLQFRRWSDGLIDETFTTDGPGYPGEVIPRIDGSCSALSLVDANGVTNLSWERRIERFARESAEPLDGRLMLSITPQRHNYDNLGWFIVTDFTVVSNTLTLTCSGTAPAHFTVGQRIRVEADNPSLLPSGWTTSALYTLLFADDAYLDIVTITPGSGTFTITASVPGILDTSYTPETNHRHYLFGAADTGKALVGDVRLFVGNRSQRFGFSDVPVAAEPSNSVRDQLLGGIDIVDNVVPAGLIVLYTGGGTCPAGFKPVDGFANSASAGLSYYQIPIPDAVTYDATTDRTQLDWSTTNFPIYDSDGNVIKLDELQQVLRVTLPTTSGDVVTGVEPPAQAAQPGVFIKVPSIASGSTSGLGAIDNLGGDYSTQDFEAVYDDRSKSFLITDLKYDADGVAPSYNNAQSSLPWSAVAGTTYPQASGKGTLSYPYVIDISLAELPTSSLDQTYPPMGPVGAEQDQIFEYNNSSGVVDALILEGNPGNPAGSKIGYSTSTQLKDDFESQLQVGDVYYFSWAERYTGSRTGAFIGRVVYVKKSENYFNVVRYDGYPLNYEGVPTAGTWDIPVDIRPAKLFGVGKHALVNSTVVPQGVSINRTSLVDTNGIEKDYWVVTPNSVAISLIVKGNLTIPANTQYLRLESSGFLKSGEPQADLDYGSNGHTHLMEATDSSITVTNLVPRVNESTASGNTYAQLPWYSVPSGHHHGYLPVYRWPLPKFHLFTLCEKL
jgi:hypothetical protein